MKKSKNIVQKQPLSFGDWLLLHLKHETPCGDLARDALSDPLFFPGLCSTKKMKEILEKRNACEAAMNTLKDAILVYNKYKCAVAANLIIETVYEDNLRYYGYNREEKPFTTD
tara:strand:- start:172 stop:510 length:339 start_codon:yes stop_codon:yes gene_type:complete